MKIKRLYAGNIREAMRQLREELGPEAVILSNKRTGDGIEIVAAIDYDEKLLEQQVLPEQGALSEDAKATLSANQPAHPDAESESESESDAKTESSADDVVVSATTEPPEMAMSVQERSTKPRVVWSQDPMLLSMQEELKTIRALLEQHITGLAWGELIRQQPHRAALLQRLFDWGLSPTLAEHLSNAVAIEPDLEKAWPAALRLLGDGLNIVGDGVLTEGGVIALLGPTGVGKTTTVAKLAAQYTLRHGPRKVALLTTDSHRIGAFDQLRTFGMILDIPVRMAASHKELQSAISDFKDKPLILIDTAGMSPRDVRLAHQFTLIGATPQVKRYLVLAANAELSHMEEALTAFSQAPLQGCILTKLDEVSQLGTALSLAHEHKLALAYLSDGQRIPEDLHVARLDALLEYAHKLSTGVHKKVISDESLALTFGKDITYGRS